MTATGGGRRTARAAPLRAVSGGVRPLRVLVFGTYDTRVHPRVGVLIEGLRAHGDEVIECNVPLGLDTAARVRMLRQPWRLPRLLLRLLWCWVRLLVRSRRLPTPDVVLVGYLGHFDVQLARLLYRRKRIVLDYLVGASDTARDRYESGRLKHGLLAWLDRAALRSADLVIVDTEEQRDTLPERVQAKTTVVLVGAPFSWFRAQQEPAVSSGPLRVVFFSLFTPLHGAPVVAAALDMLAASGVEVDALVIGHGQELSAARAAAAHASCIRWVDWVEAAELPALVAERDVCLGIFGTTDKALRVVPNKVYQGAAAGCAIVTSNTDPQRRALDDAALFVPPGDPAALAEALRTLAIDRGVLARLRAASHAVALERFTPPGVSGPLHATLNRVATRRDAAVP